MVAISPAYVLAVAAIPMASAQINIPPIGSAVSSIFDQATSLAGGAIATATSAIGGAISTATSAAGSAVTPVTGEPCAEYTRCISDIDAQVNATCTPLKSTNATLEADCQCIFAVNKKNCYSNCPENAQVIQAAAQQAPQIVSLCSAASLDPLNLPKTAPWQSYFTATPTTLPTNIASAASSAVAAATSAAGSAIASATGAANSNSGAAPGFSVDNIVVALVPVVAGLVGAIAAF